MKLHPILSALRKHKAGIVLITLQVALTMAIVCNAVFIIGRRIERVNRPTGLNEKNLFLVYQRWVDAPTGQDPASIDKLDAMQREDLATLRGLPDVESATPVTSVPLLNKMLSFGYMSTKPGVGRLKAKLNTAYFFVGNQMLKTLGLRLIEGRAFRSTDIFHQGYYSHHSRDVIIVTKAIADRLFPKGAVGKTVYLSGSSKPSTIIGVVQRMEDQMSFTWADSFAWYSTLIPGRIDAAFSRYAVRAKPGRLRAAMREVAPALYKTNPMRVLGDGSVRSFAEIRANAYRSDIGMAVLMSVICLIIIAATAAGIVGLSSFWVGQRHKQIGIRRAVGARRGDILRYFQTENFLIVTFGIVLGAVLAIGINLILMKFFELSRLSYGYLPIGALVLWGLGQCAVLVPAIRASRVPPVVATRSV